MNYKNKFNYLKFRLKRKINSSLFFCTFSLKNTTMNIPQRIAPFVQLGELLKADYQQPGASALIQKSYLQNYWFTPAFTAQSLQAIAEHYLDADKLRAWLADYELAPVDVPQKIGVVMAGNIPAVGFHDALCVLISGHHLLAKLS
ncbi:MAG: acyl-CoA reductase, partial [Runella slithyformis]